MDGKGPQDSQRQKEARAQAFEFLQGKWEEPVLCPICKTGGWSIGDVFDGIVREDSRVSYSFVPIMCKNCSYTMLINAVIAGATERTKIFAEQEADDVGSPESSSDEEGK